MACCCFCLISTYLLIAFTSSRLAERLSIVLFAAVLLLGLRNSPLSRRRGRPGVPGHPGGPSRRRVPGTCRTGPITIPHG
jgi:hypothetical protein